MATYEVWGSTLEESATGTGTVEGDAQQYTFDSFEDDFAQVDSPHLPHQPLPDSLQYLASLGKKFNFLMLYNAVIGDSLFIYKNTYAEPLKPQIIT